MASKMILTFSLFAVMFSLGYADECPSFWTTYESSCYRYFGSRISWNDARHHCRSFGKGVDLVSIHSRGEQTFLYTYWKSLRESATSYPRPGMWIGLIKQHDNHKWSDGSTLNYRNFDTNQKTQAGDVYFLWDWHDSTWNPKGKWHNEYDVPKWYFQFMCKMSHETGRAMRAAVN